jgi:hypothetical protein
MKSLALAVEVEVEIRDTQTLSTLLLPLLKLVIPFEANHLPILIRKRVATARPVCLIFSLKKHKPSVFHI